MPVAEPQLQQPTIFALSSGRPPAAIAIVRISGPAAFDTLSALTHKPLPRLRVMTLTPIYDPRSGIILDRGLVVRFAADASVTGEQVVEFHLHGSSAVVAAVLNALASIPALRLAHPGEFTRQAFDNGKLDLTEVEGLADLIAATTEAQRVHALDAARGGLRSTVERWREVILQALVCIEAELDFAEEQADVMATQLVAEHATRVQQVSHEAGAMLAQSGCGERLRDGLTIAIVGAPNVGKSSLLNALAKRDVAITSTVPGTTRDIIELPFELGGIPLRLIDTAGLRPDASDPVEQEGIVRARRQAAIADLVLHVCTTPPIRPLGQIVVNKIDLSRRPAGLHDGMLHVSASTGDGVAELTQWLQDWTQSVINRGEPTVISTQRQIAALHDFHKQLPDSTDSVELVMQAEMLRGSLIALSQLSGRYDPEEVLSSIFSRFCVGK